MAIEGLASTESRHDESLYVPRLAAVSGTARLSENAVLLRIDLPRGQGLGHSAGQFIEFSIFGHGEAPACVCSAPSMGNSFEIALDRRSRVGNAALGLRPGATVGVRGPYGRGFDMKALADRRVLAIAEGFGMAALRSALGLISRDLRSFKSLTVIYGCGSIREILAFDDFCCPVAGKGLDVRVVLESAGPNWGGHTGTVADALADLDLDPAETSAIIAVPPASVPAIVESLGAKGMAEERISISLHELLGCGVGKCGRCAIGPLRACTDGPVFLYSETKRYLDVFAR